MKSALINVWPIAAILITLGFVMPAQFPLCDTGLLGELFVSLKWFLVVMLFVVVFTRTTMISRMIILSIILAAEWSSLFGIIMSNLHPMLAKVAEEVIVSIIIYLVVVFTSKK